MFAAHAAQRRTPDLIWAHGLSGPGWLAADLRRRFGIPYVVHEHSSRYLSARRVSLFRRTRLSRVANGALYCAAVSAELRRQVARQLGMAEEEWAVVHNPVNPLFTEKLILSGESRNPLEPERGMGSGFRGKGIAGGEGIVDEGGIVDGGCADGNGIVDAQEGDGAFVFISVARLVPGKNQSATLRAFARFVREEDSGAKLRLVGDGPDAEKLSALIGELRLSGSAGLVGKLERAGIRAALSGADAFVFPSEAESFGVALLEAMACGLPCVATPVGIAGEVVDDSTGALIPDATPESILAGMKKVHRGIRSGVRNGIRDGVRSALCDSVTIRSRALSLSSPERFCETIGELLESRGFPSR